MPFVPISRGLSKGTQGQAKELKVIGPKRAKKAYAEKQLAKKLVCFCSLNLTTTFSLLAARLKELITQHGQKTRLRHSETASRL